LQHVLDDIVNLVTKWLAPNSCCEDVAGDAQKQSLATGGTGGNFSSVTSCTGVGRPTTTFQWCDATADVFQRRFHEAVNNGSVTTTQRHVVKER
jgi:hypothetical protein